jgi:uncharacterized protein
MRYNPNMVSMQAIDEFAQRIAEQLQPERIVLFGSHATGTAGPDSDVDLLIIMPLDGRPVAKSVEIRLKLRPPFPVDLLVRSPETVTHRLEMGDSFMEDILATGKVLYEADHNGVDRKGRRRLRGSRA